MTQLRHEAILLDDTQAQGAPQTGEPVRLFPGVWQQARLHLEALDETRLVAEDFRRVAQDDLNRRFAVGTRAFHTVLRGLWRQNPDAWRPPTSWYDWDLNHTDETLLETDAVRELLSNAVLSPGAARVARIAIVRAWQERGAMATQSQRRVV